jgi:hypothetical protein
MDLSAKAQNEQRMVEAMGVEPMSAPDLVSGATCVVLS